MSFLTRTIIFLHMSNQIANCYYRFKDLQRISKHLDFNTAAKVSNALIMVSCGLDYYNLQYHGVSQANIHEPLKLNNSLCHTVLRLNKFSDISLYSEKLCYNLLINKQYSSTFWYTSPLTSVTKQKHMLQLLLIYALQMI